jgi:cytochrome c biogenesis protein CcmG, thiol:disulfide interchange protein DsbE
MALAAAVLAISSLAPAIASAEIAAGDRAAEFIAARDGNGRRVTLKQYRNKIVVITFGASWCQPCKKELPAWEALARKYSSKGVVFLAVNIDTEPAKGKEFIKEAGLRTMRAVYDPQGATVKSYDPPTMPTTYVIDGHGIVRHRHAGYRKGDARKLAAHIDELLAR